MSPDSVPDQPQRLLPASLEDRLIGVIGRSCGVALLVAVAAGWLSLLSWSVTDPSLTHATSGTAQNLLGPLGAILSDLILQTLGLAAGIALLSPMFWGIELARHERAKEFRAKIMLYPVAVLLLAGGLSALPTTASWPLHHGFGGILGDVLLAMSGKLLALVDADRAGVVAGLMFFAAGLTAQVRSLGHDVGSLLEVMRSTPREGKQREPHFVGYATQRFSIAGLFRRHRQDGELDPGFRPSHGDSDWQSEPQAPAFPSQRYQNHQFDYVPSQVEGETDDPPSLADPGAQFGSPVPSHSAESEPRTDRDRTFERSTDAQSRAIAERFAPRSGEGARSAPSGGKARMSSRLLDSLSRRAAPAYRKPSLNALKRTAGGKATPEHTQSALRGNARLLEDVLADFGIKGDIKEIRPGPVVTLFELEPARGTKSARVIGLADDIARSMSASSARVAVVPGRNVIGIELPNARRDTVMLREILDSEAFRADDAILPLALGKSIGGDPVVTDLARMPHLLVAGTTGSGKSVGINAFIMSLLYKVTPEECRFLMIDPKMLELSVYNGIPHLLCPVVTEPLKAVAALNWAVSEMEERYKRMSRLGVRNIDVYNNRVRNALKRGEQLSRTVQTGFDQSTGQALYEREAMALETMPYIVIVVDEFADLMIVAGKEIEAAVQRLAQMARAAGIHLIMATQRPSVDIVTGTIKANFPTRISFKVASRIDSRTILNEQGAEQLLGQGDMLLSSGGGQVLRVHGAFAADEEVEVVARFLREQGEPCYIEGITDAMADADGGLPAGAAETADDIYDKAVAVVLRDRKASTSYLQRRLSIGYNRAADLIERMEQDGIVGPASAVGKRDILAPGRGSTADAA